MSTAKPRAQASAATPLQLALGMAMFGSATPVSKIVTAAMPVFIGAGLRVAIGALVLSPALRNTQALRALTRKDWLLIALLALIGMFGFSAFMLYGMRLIGGVAGAVVMSTTPAVTAAASMLFLGDQPTWRKLTAIALAVAGVLLLNLGGGQGGESETMLLGVALVFAAVCCETCYTLIGKLALDHVEPLLLSFLAAAVATPLFIPLAIWQWSSFDIAAVAARAWTAVIWYGAGTLALGSWLWYSGLKHAQGAVAAGFMGVMPASALLLSYLLLDEPFRWLHLAGFAVVFVGVLLMSWEHARQS
jgi:drug/metabolite transporter (DMT)-like permease